MKKTLKKLYLKLASRIGRAIDESKLKFIRDSLSYCGSNVVIRNPVVIEFPEKVVIEDDVSIGSFVHMWGNGRIKIGKRTLIASHVAITSATHDPDSRIMSKSLKVDAVNIENDVWIGAHAIIFPGVTIGAHAVVGAGALVREDVPPYAIVGGIPAKILRMKKERLNFSEAP